MSTSTASLLSSMTVSNFPVQLHYVLEDMERSGQSHIASWRPHGRCFQVHDRDAFTTTILPRWFNMTKFSSFQRQLNIYSFKRICSGRDQGSFYHEKFLRGMSDLTGEIKRVPIKGHAAKATVEQVPNFYQQAPLPAAVVGGGAVGNHGTVGSTYNTDLSGLSAATAPTSLTEADVPVRSAIRGPWATDVAFAAQNQHRDELFASTQSGIVPSRLSPNGPFLAANRQITMQVATTATSNRDGRIDAQLILAYLRNQAHEQDLLKRRELRFRLQMEQRQLERQSLLAAVKHIRQQEQHRSGDLLWQLGQLQGSYGAGH